MSDDIEVRPFESAGEYERMIDYFLGGDAEFLRGMGVDLAKLPARDFWLRASLADHERGDDAKERLYVAWLRGGELVGHSSLSHIEPGEQGHIHLHLWRPELRRSGLGLELFTRSMDLYFERFDLRRIVCEPYAENPAPNRVLSKLGFRLLRRYRVAPTSIAFEQDVNRYELTREERAAR